MLARYAPSGRRARCSLACLALICAACADDHHQAMPSASGRDVSAGAGTPAADSGGATGVAGTGGAAGRNLDDADADGGAAGSTGSRLRSPVLPRATEVCPSLSTGHVKVRGRDVQLWVGAMRTDVKAPIYLYWHATGIDATQAVAALGPALDEIVAQGGVVASFGESLGTGDNTSGTGIWFSDDFNLADEVVACAIEQRNIDVHRIYTGGCTAGGMQASAMVYMRSRYVAGAAIDSGGLVKPLLPEDPAHVPAVIIANGRRLEIDLVDLDELSAELRTDLRMRGGAVAHCHHMGSICIMNAPLADELHAAQWRFLKDHSFRAEPPEYRAGLPQGFPSYCELAP